MRILSRLEALSTLLLPLLNHLNQSHLEPLLVRDPHLLPIDQPLEILNLSPPLFFVHCCSVF